MTALKLFDIGSPKNPGGCHIGLYQPVLNRFLLTCDDIECARDIALIASNRYPLFLVNLVTAENYCDNLIDNLCCENWGLHASQIPVMTLHAYAEKIYSINLLVEQQHNLDEFQEEKQYLQICYHYLRLIHRLTNDYVFAFRIKNFMTHVIDCDVQALDPILNIKKQIISELYLCKDLQSTIISIKNIVANQIQPLIPFQVSGKGHDLVL